MISADVSRVLAKYAQTLDFEQRGELEAAYAQAKKDEDLTAHITKALKKLKQVDMDTKPKYS